MAGPNITATLTDVAGNTSEFSVPFAMVASVEDENSPGVPKAFSLSQNYPNPFNPETVIRYTVPKETHVMLEIVNILGQEIATLADRKQRPGYYSVRWDGKDRQGVKVASGVYLYRVEAGEFVAVRKMMLVR